MRKIGILTGGGDCPGLNAVIRGVVEKCATEDIAVFGFKDGWKGVAEQEGKILTKEDVAGIQTKGGTIIGTSRTNIMGMDNGPELVKKSMEALGLEAIVAIGGDDTLGVASQLQNMGLNMIGVPKTIDNDLSNTDYTFGFDTASNIAMEALDRLHTTAASHSRVIVAEIMGRHTGWIAIQAGLGADAHVITVPEFPTSVEEISKIINKRKEAGKTYSIIAVAEGSAIEGLDIDESTAPRDDFGNIDLPKLGIAKELAKTLERTTGLETRHVVLGHIQRGGDPSVFDRVLGSRMGVKAGELVCDKDYGNMVAIKSTEMVKVPLEGAVSVRKEVDKQFYEAAELFFG